MQEAAILAEEETRLEKQRGETQDSLRQVVRNDARHRLLITGAGQSRAG